MEIGGLMLKANQLKFDDLIHLNTDFGEITFNDKRMSLVSTEALGLFRRDLINTLGMERAKGFLMRYGWACGMKDGETIAAQYDWDNKKELMLAGPVLHSLLGVVNAQAEHIKIEEDYLYFSGTWKDSYEAMEHVGHYGHSDDNGCWTLVGYASGYLTKTFGKDVLAYETQCIGRGDQICRFVATTLDSHDKKAIKMMSYYKAESIATELDLAQRELYEINKNIITSDKIHQQLTNLLVEDKELQETIRFVAETLNKSIVIDYYNKVIESAFISGQDEVYYCNWTDNFIYQEEKQNDIRTYPIRANNINLGRLVVISKEKIPKRDELVINRALSIFTVQMYHEWKITQSLWKKKENFFEEMLNSTSKEFGKFTHLFNFHPTHLNCILCIKVVPETREKEVIQFLKNSNLLEKLDFFLNNNNIIIILTEEAAVNSNTFANKLLAELRKEFTHVHFYLGIGGNAQNLTSLRESYHDAKSICEFSLLTNPSSHHINSYEDMEHVMMFLKGTKQEELIDFYKKTLGGIIEYDQLNQTSYLMTLKSYLDNNGNLQQTADILHLSIAGLRYRMERIEGFCQIDLKTGDGRFKCQLAIQVYWAVKVSRSKKVIV